MTDINGMNERHDFLFLCLIFTIWYRFFFKNVIKEFEYSNIVVLKYKHNLDSINGQ